MAVLPKKLGLDEKKIEKWINSTMGNYSEDNPEAFGYFHDYFLSEFDPNYRMDSVRCFGKKLSQISFPDAWKDKKGSEEDFSYWLLPNGEYVAANIATAFGSTAILKNADEGKTNEFWQSQLKRIRKQYKDNYCIGLDCHIVRI